MAGAASTNTAGRSELPVYNGVVAFYFLGFGMQFVLFPSLVTFILREPAERVGLAQMALSAPMFAFLLISGVMAERVRAGPALAALQAAFALASFALAFIVAEGRLSYPILIGYAVIVGTLAAFMLPIRDATLNGVVLRDAARGRTATLAKAVSIVTAVQIGAQIVGVVISQAAGSSPAPFLAVQGGAVAAAAVLSLFLTSPAPAPREGGRTLGRAMDDLREGLAYAFKSPVMASMLLSSAFVGVFIIGVFQVLFPLIVRETYGGSSAQQAERLSILLTCFWAASFVSAATLSRLPPLRHPGRALILTQFVGAAILFTFTLEKPFWLFCALVCVWGLGGGVSISQSRTIVQSVTDPRYLGRVLAIYSTGFMGGAPIGSALVGLAAKMFGPHYAAFFPAIGLSASALILMLATPIWRLNLHEEPRLS